MLGASALLLAFASPATAQDVAEETWPEIDTFVRLKENMRIYVPLSRTKAGPDDSDQYGTIGVYFDYFVLRNPTHLPRALADAARSHRMLFRIGYGYTAAGAGQPATSTVDVEWSPRLSLPFKILATDRNRFDLNFTSGEFDPRYRNRIKFERDVALGKSFLTPYVYGEFFYSFNEGTWLKTRVAGGFELHIWERFVPEVYYQRDYGSGSRRDVQGFGLVLSIYLR